jgi:hypothetical protein
MRKGDIIPPPGIEIHYANLEVESAGMGFSAVGGGQVSDVTRYTIFLGFLDAELEWRALPQEIIVIESF